LRITVEIVATPERITLIIEGLPEDGGRVRFTTFMSQLQNLNATLSKLDRDNHDGKAVTIFEIAELSYGSPVRVVLEPRESKKFSGAGAQVIQSLRRVTGALQNGDNLSGIDADLLEDIRGLAKPVGRTVQYAALAFDGGTFDLTEDVANKLENALKVEDECDGALDGMLEQINIHLGANIFHIYPQIGPRKVTCHFPGRLNDDALAAVGRRVEIYGRLKYRSGAQFPHLIDVSGIEIFPPDSELPDWDDLRGRAPLATGDLSSEAFVRELRDAWP
jgi:hypothetical protein